MLFRKHPHLVVEDLQKRVDDLQRCVQEADATWARAYAEIREKVEHSTNAALRAEIDDLSAAVRIQQQSLRKELGKLWARSRLPEDSGGNGAVDPELQSMLALQNAGTKG